MLRVAKWLLLLLLPSLTWASNISVVRCWQPDGPYVPVADTATKCPAQLTGGATDTVTSSGYNITVSTNKSSGTIYVYTSTSSTAPSRKVHIAGTGAAHHGTITVSSSGSQTRAVSGLSSDTQYYTHILDMTTAGRPSNRIAIPQRTSASTPPATVVVEGYFWGTGGSDFSAGTAHATKFASLEPIQSLSSVATGTDIWGLSGSTHNVTSNEKFTTKWGGASGDPAYIGCYYIDGSTPTACWEGSAGGTLDLTLPDAMTENTLGSQTLPSVNGSLTDACLAAKNCDWQYPISNECSSGSDYIFGVRHSYVYIYGMKVEESACRGIDVSPGTIGQRDGALIGFRMRHSITEQIGTQAFIAYSGIKYSLVHDSIGRYLGECAKSRNSGGTYPTGTSGSLAAGGVGCSGGGSAWIYQTSTRAFSGFDNNVLVAGWTEVFHCLKSSHILMRGGVGGNVIRAGLYRDTCGDTIVERNMIWSVNGDVGFGSGTVASTQIWGGTPDSNAEINQYTSPMEPTNQLVRSNIFLGLSWCAALNLTNSAVVGGETTGGKFYHNTCVATRSRSISAGNNLTASSNLTFDMRNNVFADPNPTEASICKPSGASDTNGNYNVFAAQPVAACRGANDINSSAATDTLLTLPVGTSASPNTANIGAYRAVTYDNPMSYENVRPTAGTLTGTRLNNTACITDADLAEWEVIFSDMTDAPTGSTWKMCAAEYYDGEAIADTPVIGALKN